MNELFEVIETFLSNPTEDNQVNEKVWNLLVDIAENDCKHLYLIYDALNKFSSNSQNFTADSFKAVDDRVEKLKSDQISFDEKIKVAKSLCSVIQYIKPQTANDILKEIANLAAIEIKNENKIPEKVVSLVDSIRASDLMNETLTIFFDYVEGTQTIPVIYVFAPLAITILQMVPASYDSTPEIIAKLLEGDENSQLAALFLVERISDYNYTADVFENILPFITSQNSDLCVLANKATRQLINSGTFDIEFIVPEVMGMIDSFTDQNIRLFGKMINKIIEICEEFPKTLADKILESIEQLANNDGTNFKATYLDIFCTIASRCPPAIESKLNLAKSSADYLLEKSSHIDILGAYVVAVIKFIPSFVDDISTYIPKIINLLDSNIEIKNRLKAAEYIAVASKERQFDIQKLFNFVNSSLKVVSGTKIFYACSPVSELSQILDENQSKDVFSNLRAILLKEEGGNETDAVLSVMSLFFENHKVPQEMVLESLNDIMNGKIAYLTGISPVQCPDESTTIFHYISEAIKYYPNLQSSVLTFFLAAIKASKEYLLPAVLDIVKGLTFDEDTASLLFKTLIERVSQLRRNNEDAICASMEALFIIMQNSPNQFNANQTIEIISSIVFAESEEEEEILDESYAFSAMVRLYFSICASNVPAEINHDLFNDYISLLPFDESLEGAMIPIYDALADILAKPEFLFASLNIAKVIAEPILLNQRDRLDIGIEQSLYDKMRFALKSAIKSVKGLERNLTKGWSRSNLNKLSSALK